MQENPARSVPLARIVGSAGCYQDFDNLFQFKDHLPSQQLETIKEPRRQGRTLPPVTPYQIKNDYYVYTSRLRSCDWSDHHPIRRFDANNTG